MNYKQIILKRGKEDSLLRFHPWIFSGAIAHIDQPIDEGEVVRVLTHDKQWDTTRLAQSLSGCCLSMI